MDCDLTSRRVLMVLGMDLRIYRVSVSRLVRAVYWKALTQQCRIAPILARVRRQPDSSRMLGWQPHEMLNLHLVHFFPVFERTKWETFSR